MDQAPGLLCVHAHPDDECITTGGVLARAADEGRRTGVVTCTGGELGQVVGEGMDAESLRPRLEAVRREELARALTLLGAGEPRLLGYRDSGMAGSADNDRPEAFWQASFGEAVGRLVAHIRAFRPSVLVTYDAVGIYGHPDHVQAHRVGLVAAEASAADELYPEAGPPWRVAKVYLATLPKSAVARLNGALAAAGLDSPFGVADRAEDVTFGTPDERVTTAVDVAPWLDRKRRALRAHATQVGPDSFFFDVPDQLADTLFGTEWFVRHRSDVDCPRAETDLFAGLGPCAR